MRDGFREALHAVAVRVLMPVMVMVVFAAFNCWLLSLLWIAVRCLFICETSQHGVIIRKHGCKKLQNLGDHLLVFLVLLSCSERLLPDDFIVAMKIAQISRNVGLMLFDGRDLLDQRAQIDRICIPFLAISVSLSCNEYQEIRTASLEVGAAELPNLDIGIVVASQQDALLQMRHLVKVVHV